MANGQAETEVKKAGKYTKRYKDNADELADRVCIMSHGKVIALGSPANIKRRFGVGYNLYVEPRSSQDLSN